MWRRAVSSLDDVFYRGLLTNIKFRSGDLRNNGTVVFTLLAGTDHMSERLYADSEIIARKLAQVLGRPVKLNIEHMAYDQTEGFFSIRDAEEAERNEEIRSMKNEALSSEMSRELKKMGAVPVLFVPLPDGGFIRITEEEAR